MKKIFSMMLVSLSVLANDIIIKDSYCSVDQTIDNLKHILNQKGLRIFTVVDHEKNAKLVKMNLSASKVIIFGNPKVGTSFMQQNITAGLDLPMKILVYEDNEKNTKVAYRNVTSLANTFAFKDVSKVETVNGALDKITTRAGLCKKD